MNTNTDVHTCNYYCERPGCIRAQRDELRDRMASALAAPPSAPVGVEAVRGAWLAAITLANNICVQESDRENDRDGDTGWIDGTAECAKRIREYAHPTDAELLEMLDEAGANAAKAALAQQPAAVDGLAARLVAELDGLVGESYGVSGLHLNGDVAPWDDLLPGGRFERLSSLDELRAALAAQQQEPTT